MPVRFDISTRVCRCVYLSPESGMVFIPLRLPPRFGGMLFFVFLVLPRHKFPLSTTTQPSIPPQPGSQGISSQFLAEAV